MPSVDFSRVASNIAALNTLYSLNNINSQLAVHQGRLASGKRINSAGDDPAGLTIATKLNSRNEGLKVAMGNVGDAKNMLAVAESGLGRINDILIQMRNKSEAAASDTMGTDERKAIVDQLKGFAAQVDDIATQTKWNGEELLDGSYDGTALSFQVGADQADVISFNGLKNIKASHSELDLATVDSANSSVSVTADTAYDLLGAAPTAGNATGDNLDELASGTYTVEVTYGGTAGSATTIRLKDSNGNYLLIDTDNNLATDAVDTVAGGAGFDLDTAPLLVDFGNGLRATINDLATAAANANGTYTAEVSYTKAGTYTLDKVGGGSLTEASSASDFAAYMDQIQDGIDLVSTQLTKIGSMSSRLTFKEEQLAAAQINTEAAYSRIMNANMAEEQVNAAKLQILQQTSTAMLAQANSAPQFLLSLFR
ncbi:MAG: hypothetical protein EHM39_09605 [Chloroflexi bacterium]|nr:MAG: hypothetical protein EHM39_09605 [Chloroflexota bacterium]